MKEIVSVEPEYGEMEFTETVEKVVEDPEIDRQIEELQRRAEELGRQLDDIMRRIDELMAKKKKTETVKVRKRVAILKCPRCSAQNVLVVGDKLTIRVRCTCGTILASV